MSTTLTTPQTPTPGSLLPSPPVLHQRSGYTRVWNVVRLHLVDKRTYIGIPWLIVAASFVITALLSNMVGYAAESTGADITDETYFWGVLAPQWYLLVVAVQSISYSFPFALGYSVTRRDFYLGTSLLFLLISTGNAVAFTLLGQIERATDGWGINTRLFTTLWFGRDEWYVDLLAYFVLQMLVFFVGASIATVYMRWRMRGMVVFWISLAAVVVGILGAITYSNGWPAVGAWGAAQGIAGIFSWLLLPTAVAGICGYLALRRATPKG